MRGLRRAGDDESHRAEPLRTASHRLVAKAPNLFAIPIAKDGKLHGSKALTPRSRWHRRHTPPEYGAAPDQGFRRTARDSARDLVVVKLAEGRGNVCESLG